MKYITLFLATIFFFGCADTHRLTRVGKTTTLLKDASIYISIPKNGHYGKTEYHGSGSTTAQIILRSFSAHIVNVETAPEFQTFSTALAHAKTRHFEYLVYPTILAWEDRATEWSSIPDKVSIKIAIVSSETGQTVNAAIIDGKSGIATFGGDKPQDLLGAPISKYVSQLFQ